MNKTEVDQIPEVVELLIKADTTYYNTGETVMTDQQYDLLRTRLKKIDPTNPYLRRVGAPPIGQLSKHKIPMGSQEKLEDETAFKKWAEKIIQAKVFEVVFVVQLKLDGISVSLDYEEGVLMRVLTRGDGKEGEDITCNALMMQGVKPVLPDKFTGSLRGEVMLRKDTFKKIFEPLGYKNPRNTVSGLSRDQKKTGLQQHFAVICYDFADGLPGEEELATEVQRIEFLSELGIKTVKTHPCKTVDEVWAKYKEIEGLRQDIELEIDGIIVRANSLGVQEDLGMSSDGRCPKGQRCVKFESLGAETKLVSVELTIGHTGAIIPTGKVEPVEIGGVTVSSVLLNNFEFIEKLGVAIGDTVRVIRAGDVIPYAEEVMVRPKNRQPIVPPEKCIACGSKLVKDGAHIFCRNEECEGQEFQKLKSYVNKRNIKFLGEELLLTLYENHNIKTPPDLYKLTEEFLSKVKSGNGVVGSNAKRIMPEIEKSKKVQLCDFFGSLGLKLLGRRQAEILVGAGINTFDKFMNLKVSDILGIPGFGTSATEGSKGDVIVAGLKSAKGLIQGLLDAGVEIDKAQIQKTVIEGAKLSGWVVCFTGVRPQPDEEAKFVSLGGVLKDGVSKSLSHLVVKDTNSTSNKATKAKELGVKVISYQEFQNSLA